MFGVIAAVEQNVGMDVGMELKRSTIIISMKNFNEIVFWGLRFEEKLSSL